MKNLKKYGVSVSIVGGEVELSGLSSLATDQYNDVVIYAKNNKESILRETRPGIKPMTSCLHNKSCMHLDAPGKIRPLCLLAEMPVFDLDFCPLGYWTAAAPYALPPERVRASEG
jgi:hypothetical protein